MVLVVTGIRVQRQLVQLPAGVTVADPVCEDDPDDCCAVEPSPDPECDLCDTAPLTWSFTAAGFTGDHSAYNDDWTLALDGDCTWTQTIGDATATLVITAEGMTLTFTRDAPAVSVVEYVTADPVAPDCCEEVEVEHSSTTGSGDVPATITLTSGCDPGELVDVGNGCMMPTSVLAEIFSGSGACDCALGVTATLVYDPGTNPTGGTGFWEGDLELAGCPGAPTVNVKVWFPSSTSVRLKCTGDSSDTEDITLPYSTVECPSLSLTTGGIMGSCSTDPAEAYFIRVVMKV